MHSILADGHTASNAPDLFRPPKLSGAGPGQYWGGGPPGKTLGCCQLFVGLRSLHLCHTTAKRAENIQESAQKYDTSGSSTAKSYTTAFG